MKLPPLLVYSVLRLLAFLVPLAIMWIFFPIMREFWWLTAIFAALIGASISFLFLRRPLAKASAGLHERRQARAVELQSDEDAEDTASETKTPGDVASPSAPAEDTAPDARPRPDSV